MKREINIKSDFWDCYDIWANRYSFNILERYTTDEINRKEMFEFFEENGIKIPLWGIIGENISLNKNTEIVVYEDICSHKGEGKIKTTFGEALISYPNKLFSLYIKENAKKSWRYLQVGKKSFIIEYISYKDWRSNVGDGEINYIGEAKNEYYGKIKRPLFAIDFVGGYKKYAVDLNIAPQIRQTGLEHVITTEEMYHLIRNEYFRIINKAGKK